MIAIFLLSTFLLGGMWIWSYWQHPWMYVQSSTTRFEVGSVWGRARFSMRRSPKTLWSTSWKEGILNAGPVWRHWDTSANWHFAGFALMTIQSTKVSATLFTIPYWFLLSLVITPLFITVIQLWRTHHPGTCGRCGYDLRASSGYCPECGRPFDPDDRKTYSQWPRRGFGVLGWLCIALSLTPTLLYASIVITWIIARFSLGHWPDRPRYAIDGDILRFSYKLADLLFLLTFLAFPATVVATFAYGFLSKDRVYRFFTLVLIVTLLWLAAFTLVEIFREPVSWFMDT